MREQIAPISNQPASLPIGAFGSSLRPIGEIAFALTARRIREHVREIS